MSQYDLLEDEDEFEEPEAEGCCSCGSTEGGAYGLETCFSCGDQFCGETCGAELVPAEDADEDWDDHAYRQQFCGSCLADYRGEEWLDRGRFS